MAEAIPQSIIPDNDSERLEALRRYHILDTPPEEAFDNLVQLLADTFGVPIALISLVDKDRVFFKGNVGMPGVRSTPRSVSLCSFAILSEEPTIFDKPLEEPCLLSNPLVHGEFGLRFYAGAPLTTQDGFHVGSVCVVDKRERHLSEKERGMLVRFARVVMHEIEMREGMLRQKEAEEMQQARNQELRFVADTMPQLVWATHPDGSAYYFNQKWMDYTGLSFEQVCGSGWMNALHPEDARDTRTAWEQAVLRGAPYDVEYRLQRHDGVYRWFIARGTPMKDEAGNILRWYGTSTDIEDQKRAEEELERRVEERTRQVQAAQQLMQGIVENARNGITVTEVIRNEQGQIIDARTILANRASETHTGISREQTLAHTVTEMLPGVLGSPLFQQALHTLQTGDPFITQYFIELSHKWIELAVSKLDDSRLINIFTDVTPIREAQIKLEQLVEQLKRSNGELEQFTYVSHHDLQEPLRKIMMFTDMVRNDSPELPAAALKRLDKVNDAARRMSRALRDVLNYARLNREEAFSAVDLNEVMLGVLADLELLIYEKQAQIAYDRLPVIRAVPHQMHQLFFNLVHNALKFEFPGRRPELAIRCRELSETERTKQAVLDQGERYFELQFRDNGIGFGNESAEKIFVMFQRLHDRDTYAGSGIGLALCRKVVQNHGGIIRAESERGKGATFLIILPAGEDPSQSPLSPEGGA